MRVYKYGLLAPTENAEIVREQMRAAHRYRNTLVEIERGRRDALRTEMASFGDVAALEDAAHRTDAAVGEAVRAVKAHKATHRTNTIPDDLRANLDSARVAKRDAVQAWREVRARIRADEQAQLRFDAINDAASELRKNAYLHSGLYWGTRAIVDDADQAARKAPLYDGVEPSGPRFLRFDGDGALSMQLQEDPNDGQQGYTVASLYGDNARARIASRVEVSRNGRGKAKTEGSRRSNRARMLMLRVGSDDRDPVWAAWPMIMHRPLPEGGRVKRVTVHRHHVGPREDWSVTLTVDDSATPQVRATRAGAVAINLGWRVVPEGIRVVTWVGEDGGEGHITLDARTLSGVAKADELRGTRDDNFNAARAALVTWIEARRLALLDVPEWFVEATRTLSDWKSPARLAALARQWRSLHLDDDADEEAYSALERWRYRDHHLWTWETSQRTGALRHRQDVFRVASARLAARYDVLVYEDFDLREPAKRRAPDAPRDNEGARANRQAVAPSECRSALINAFRGAVDKRSAAFLTQTCHACGVVEAFDAAAKVWHRCEHCGALWDQDLNLARNLLAHHIGERSSGGESAGPAREAETSVIPETRWTKARRLRAEKDARKEGARKAQDNAAE
jgi:hypothetical protein